MRFWDTSAIIPLVVDEEATTSVRALLSADPSMAAWWATPVESASALARLRREELITAGEEEQSLSLLAALRASWTEVLPSNEVRDRAVRLVRVHSLRAADALQLAAAQLWAGPASSAELVTFDERLALAARLEGLRVLGATGTA